MKMKYRLALDLGSTSLGWAMVRINEAKEPVAVIKAGVRIFSDGRNPKDGSSLAVTRRDARAMRRRRDRLLKRKSRMMNTLVAHGFFPNSEDDRKALEQLNPYELRAKGLDEALTGEEFARALFHINQRRGFKSNRKTDKKDTDSGALKTAISQLQKALAPFPTGDDNKRLRSDQFDLLAWVNRQLTETQNNLPRSVGELLHKRFTNSEVPADQRTVRARFRQTPYKTEDGKNRIDKSYDLYIDRAMIEDEFDALWRKQADLNPALFHETARAELKDCLLHQRPLKPVKAGRCTLMPEEERAPLALPSTQRARILQEVNHLRILREGLQQEPLTMQQRNDLVEALEQNSKRSFTQIKKLLGFGGTVQFNFEDPKRQELKGNVTSAALSRDDLFGERWFEFSEAQQDEIVLQLVKEENESKLIKWLIQATGVDERTAEVLANTGLTPGYGSLSSAALDRIIPALRADVIPYSQAVKDAGFDHHSQLNPSATGEILPELPYYGEPLRRFVAFGTGVPNDPPEKKFGKIANPTVHIGLNQVRTVVNALIKRYGHPSQVIVEVARELKQSQEQRDEANKRQADNQRRNARIRESIAGTLNIGEERVRIADIQKWILWEELSFDVADRKCPYSGETISAAKLLSPAVEIEHILPFSETLDDSLNNKTVATREANRIKRNRTPWDARDDFESQGWAYDSILLRAERMPRGKRYRFAHDGREQWLKNDKSFLARALNDTRYLSRVAREYVSLICPQDTRVIPGQMTAMLRAKFGLNDILGLQGEKNRNDHRHHAVDACVIAVTDQGMLQRFAKASASTRERQLNRLVDSMPQPWGADEDKSYWNSVKRAIDTIWVSHKPDHGHEGAMHNDTAYGLLGNGRVSVHKVVEGKRTYVEDNLKVIEFTSPKASERHGLLPDGQPRPYKGYKGDSNYCIEIVRNEKGKWEGEVISTFEAYQLVRIHGLARLQHPTLSISGKSLVMRLMIGDFARLEIEGKVFTGRISWVKSNTQIALAAANEANTDARARDNTDPYKYVVKAAGVWQKHKARRVTISSIGELRDPGFKE